MSGQSKKKEGDEMANKKNVPLCYRDRILIEKMTKDGISNSGMGIIMGKHDNSISREINLHCSNRKFYSALKAQLQLR